MQWRLPGKERYLWWGIKLGSWACDSSWDSFYSTSLFLHQLIILKLSLLFFFAVQARYKLVSGLAVVIFGRIHT